MISLRHYLVRAYYDWIKDNGLSPYIVVSADLPGVNVPRQHVDEGKIVLNLSPEAIRDLEIDANALAFHARFSGSPFHVYMPVRAIVAIYAQESGEGRMFRDDEFPEESEQQPVFVPPVKEDLGRPAKRVAPHLTLVSGTKSDADEEE